MTKEQKEQTYIAERHLDAGVLHGGNAMYHEAAAITGEASFANDVLRAVWIVYAAIVAGGGVIDAATLQSALPACSGDMNLTPGEIVSFLLDTDAEGYNAAYYARQVADAALIRQVTSSLYVAYNAALGWEGDGRSLLDDVQRRILSLGSGGDTRPAKLEDLIPEQWERFQEIYNSPKSLVGLSTGLSRLDWLTQGLQAEDVIVIKAKTGEGKSVLAQNLAQRAASCHGTTTAIFSLEMSKAQLLRRMAFAESKVPSSLYKARKLSREQWGMLHDAHERLKQMPIFLYDDSGLTLAQIASRCRALKASDDLGLVIVDYAQLVIPTPGGREGNREREVAEISRTLKVIASDLSLPVILVSQINDDGRLRESRALGHDASIVLFLESLEPAPTPDSEPTKPGKSVPSPYKLTVEKNRDGEKGVIPLLFNGDITLFTERTDDYLKGF